MVKTIEKVEMPENWYVPREWMRDHADKTGTLDGVVVPWPSNKDAVTYLITIGFDRSMSCSCEGFKFKGVCSHIKKLRWIASRHPRNTRAISIEAYYSHSVETLNELRLRLLRAIAERPRTCDELQVDLGLLAQTASAEISHLYHDNGLIEPTGEERPTRSGRKSTVWRCV